MGQDYQTMLTHIERIIGDIAAAKGASKPPRVHESMRLLGGELPIDSLDLAGILVQLESVTGYDPFKEGFINFRTVGELARLYER
jgi:acyl carrier protein